MNSPMFLRCYTECCCCWNVCCLLLIKMVNERKQLNNNEARMYGIFKEKFGWSCSFGSFSHLLLYQPWACWADLPQAQSNASPCLSVRWESFLGQQSLQIPAVPKSILHQMSLVLIVYHHSLFFCWFADFIFICKELLWFWRTDVISQ